jgi:hypothetical protein
MTQHQRVIDLTAVEPEIEPNELAVYLVTRVVDRHALDDDDFAMLLEMLLGTPEEHIVG